MVRYVLWNEVQQRLEQWKKEHGTPTRFLHALSLLREENQVRECEAMPPVDFTSWDCDDMNSFHDLTASLPVDAEISANPDVLSVSPSAFVHKNLDTRPIKIAHSQRKYLHYHENYELLYALSGEGGMITQTGTIPYPEGTLCLIAPNVVHDVYANTTSDVLSMALWRESAEAVLYKLIHGENIVAEFFHTSLSRRHPGYVILVEVSEIKASYEQAVGHAIGGSQIYYVLRRNGWRKVMPRSKHPKKASEEVIDTNH